jgi:hypothetical protein
MADPTARHCQKGISSWWPDQERPSGELSRLYSMMVGKRELTALTRKHGGPRSGGAGAHCAGCIERAQQQGGRCQDLSNQIALLMGGRRHRVRAIVNAVGDGSGLISRQHFGGLDLVTAFQLLDLLGPALFRRLAKLGSNGVRVHQLLSEAWLGECEHRNKTYLTK